MQDLIQETFGLYVKHGLYAPCACVMSSLEAGRFRRNIPQPSQPVILSDWRHYADIPYAWVNLQKGVGYNELLVEETNTAAVGSFTLEMGLLSRLTGTSSSQS